MHSMLYYILFILCYNLVYYIILYYIISYYMIVYPAAQATPTKEGEWKAGRGGEEGSGPREREREGESES